MISFVRTFSVLSYCSRLFWTLCPYKGCYVWTFGQYARKMSDVRPLFQAMCRYGMFSSVSGILKEEMSPHLGVIVARMMESLITQEGITVSTCMHSGTSLLITDTIGTTWSILIKGALKRKLLRNSKTREAVGLWAISVSFHLVIDRSLVVRHSPQSVQEYRLVTRKITSQWRWIDQSGLSFENWVRNSKK